MEDKLRNHTLVGLSYSICSQGDRLTGAFNYYYPLPEGPILKKIINSIGCNRKCQPISVWLVVICNDLKGGMQYFTDSEFGFQVYCLKIRAPSYCKFL